MSIKISKRKAISFATITILVLVQTRDFWLMPHLPYAPLNLRASSLAQIIGTWIATDEIRRSSDYVDLVINTVPDSLHQTASGDLATLTTGEYLPNEFMYGDSFWAPNSPLNLENSIQDGRLVTMSFDEYVYSLTLLRQKASFTDTEQLRLMQWLETRANSIPPSRLDVLLIWSPNLDQSSEDLGDGWKRLARARNPIYRLWASSALRPLPGRDNWHIDSSEAFDLAVQQLGEKNSIFHDRALDRLEFLGINNEKTRWVIKAFVENPDVPANDGTIFETGRPCDVTERARGLLADENSIGES